MTNPRLLDTDGNAYSPELDWSGVKDEPIVSEMVTIERKVLDELRAEVIALRKALQKYNKQVDWY